MYLKEKMLSHYNHWEGFGTLQTSTHQLSSIFELNSWKLKCYGLVMGLGQNFLTLVRSIFCSGWVGSAIFGLGLGLENFP